MGMMIHCGGEHITRADPALYVQPARTDTHYPIAHNMLLEMVEQTFKRKNWEVLGQDHAVNKEGMQLFSLYDIAPVVDHGVLREEDWGLQVALRNSHDKSFSATVAIGARVFVCDNLSISGEIMIGRKHTPKIEDDLHILVDDAISRARPFIDQQRTQFRRYKESQILDADVDNIIMEFYRQNVLNSSKLGMVYDDFTDGDMHNDYGQSAWKLFNAVTNAIRPKSVNAHMMLSRKTITLHHLMDDYTSGRWDGSAMQSEIAGPSLIH